MPPTNQSRKNPAEKAKFPRPLASRGDIDPFIVMDVLSTANALESRGEDVVHMEVGQPGTPAPRAAIEAVARGAGYGLVRDYCGHGIGRGFHEDPQVLHYGRKGTGEVLVPGMVFTIEPMVNLGRRETRLMPDGWTVVTRDRSLSAQWEHTIAVTEDGHDVLTRLPGDPL